MISIFSISILSRVKFEILILSILLFDDLKYIRPFSKIGFNTLQFNTNESTREFFEYLNNLKFLEFNYYRCNKCQSKVIIETLSDDIKDQIDRIDKNKMLPVPEVKILKELQNSDSELYARDIAQEVDYSGQLIGWRAKKLDEQHNLINRKKEAGKTYKYILTPLGIDFFTGK